MLMTHAPCAKREVYAAAVLDMVQRRPDGERRFLAAPMFAVMRQHAVESTRG